MEGRIDELERNFFFQLRRIKQIKPSQDMVPEGVTANEGLTLMIIEFCEKTGAQGRPGIIAEHLHLTKSGVSQILRSLGEKGLIARKQSKDDFRIATLSLTEAGKATCVAMDELREKNFHRVFERFGADDFEQLVSLLDKFATCMEQQREDARGARS